MGTTRIYHEEDDRYYNINYDLYSGNLSDGDGTVDYYLLINTDMRYQNGSALPNFRVRSLSDVPPGESPASDFTALLNLYIEWFMEQAEFGLSSSSSSTSSSSSSISSSSSSSGVAPEISSSSTMSSASSESVSSVSESSSSESSVSISSDSSKSESSASESSESESSQSLGV